jgi:hypothetical protein
VTKRAEKWREFKTDYIGSASVSKYFDAADWAGLKGYTKQELDIEVQNNATYHFCNVKRAFLKHFFENIMI